MFKKLAKILGGLLIAATAAGAGQPFSGSAQSIQITSDSTVHLTGGVVVTIQAGATYQSTAQRIVRSSDGDVVLEGGVRLVFEGGAILADRLVVKKSANGLLEVTGDSMRIVRDESR